MVRQVQTLDLTFPSPPFNIAATGEADAVRLVWDANSEPDLTGYNIYRSTNQAGPFAKVNVVPTDRIAYYHDEGLQPLTKFFYRVTAVDSSGNESQFIGTQSVSTNPPHHAIFPVPTAGTTPSSVAVDYAYSSQFATIAAGSEVLYVLNADGSAPVDADGAGATLGDFSTRGAYFAAGPSMSVLAPGEGMSFIAPSWDSTALYVFDKAGHDRPGFPFKITDNLWASAAITDLDGDGHMEIVFASGIASERRVYVLRENGQEWIDGDANPSTKGVFKVMGSAYNVSSPAVADLDGDGHPEIIVGSTDGKLYAWKANGANVPGFPFVTNGAIFSSPAIGFLDGTGDSSPEIVFSSTNDSLYVLNADGKRRAGWPVLARCGGV